MASISAILNGPVVVFVETFEYATNPAPLCPYIVSPTIKVL